MFYITAQLGLTVEVKLSQFKQLIATKRGKYCSFPSSLLTTCSFCYLCKLCCLLQCSINQFSSSVCSKLISAKKQIVSWQINEFIQTSESHQGKYRRDRATGSNAAELSCVTGSNLLDWLSSCIIPLLQVREQSMSCFQGSGENGFELLVIQITVCRRNCLFLIRLFCQY